MKRALRRELKKKRAELDNRALLSERITDAFLATDLYKNAEAVLLYYSTDDEVSTRKIFLHALASKKRVAFPVCLDGDGVMEFCYVNSAEDLRDDMYGIRAPKSCCEKFVNRDKAICIVPGIAFDKKGYRLGYGKGYYDRFLEKFKGISIGFCFENMLEYNLPTDEYDKKVDYLITDKTIYNFNDKEDLKYG